MTEHFKRIHSPLREIIKGIVWINLFWIQNPQRDKVLFYKKYGFKFTTKTLI